MSQRPITFSPRSPRASGRSPRARQDLNPSLATHPHHHINVDGFDSKVTTMSVYLAGRDFLRLGSPVSGGMFGAKVGEMLWKQMVQFEAVGDPLESTPIGKASTYNPNGSDAVDNPARFFYPFSQQESGASGPDYMDDIVYPSDVGNKTTTGTQVDPDPPEQPFSRTTPQAV